MRKWPTHESFVSSRVDTVGSDINLLLFCVGG